MTHFIYFNQHCLLLTYVLTTSEDLDASHLQGREGRKRLGKGKGIGKDKGIQLYL